MLNYVFFFVIILLKLKGGNLEMSVSVKNNNVDFAIKKFKTEIAREGTLSKARERADGYKKPGVRHREEKKINTINSRKNNKYRNN